MFIQASMWATIGHFGGVCNDLQRLVGMDCTIPGQKDWKNMEHTAKMTKSGPHAKKFKKRVCAMII